MMRKVYKLIAVTILTLGFTGCGSDSSSSSNRTSIIACSETTNIPDGYTTLDSGTIVKEDNNTTITIYHDSDGNKKICVQSGSAYITQ